MSFAFHRYAEQAARAMLPLVASALPLSISTTTRLCKASLARVSQLREDASAVGAIRRDLALVLVGEPRQGGGEVEGGLRQGNLQQEAHGT